MSRGHALGSHFDCRFLRTQTIFHERCSICRLYVAACYNAGNCEVLQESMLELQMLLLQNQHLFAHSSLLAKLLATVTTIKELFAMFSAR